VTPRSRFVPRPFELLTFGLTLAVVGILRASGLRMDLRTVSFMAGPMIRRLPFALGLGLALQALGLALHRRSPRAWLRAVATPASALLWLRVWLAAMAMTYAYSWLKVSVPLLRRTLLDPALWSLDRTLHLGVSPSVFVVELVRGTPLAGWLDLWYGFWVTSVLAALAYVFLSERVAERRNFAFACAFLWLGGVWVYLALPALGPCFASPDVFAGILGEMPHTAFTQSVLWQNYLRMLAGRDGTLRQFNPYLGVAAFPSLHVGAHWLFALWARRHERRLFLPLAAATGVTFLASVASGWHYAVDGYAGMLLAWLAVRVADRFEPVSTPLGREGLGEQEAGDQRHGDEDHAERGLDAENDVAVQQ
jgi:PAP2 superfamily